MDHKMKLKNLFFKTFSKDAKKGERISPQDAYAAVQGGKAVLLDVREEEELKEEGIASPALWLATSEIESQSPKAKKLVAELPRGKTVIVYCAAGVRAGRFADTLARQGFKTANLGGFDDWASAKLPVKKYP